MKRIVKHLTIVTLIFLSCISAHAQFLDGATGLLQMPTAEMNQDGTFMLTTNYINHHSLSPARWKDYNTFGYALNVSFWDRLELAYVCVMMHGTRYYSDQPEPEHWKNQDRHFSAKVLLVREGEFGKEWMPAFAVGISDPTSADGGGYETGVTNTNGFFNRYYAVLSKHIPTGWGEIGAHAGYQFNRRVDVPLNGPCAGIAWKPVWVQTDWLSLDLIAEYDSRTFNIGFIASVWDDRIEAMFDLQALKWVSFGLRYKMHIR